MLERYYAAKYITKVDNGIDPVTDLWHFRSQKTGRLYYILVEHHPRGVLSVKFYARQHKGNPQRYALMTGDREPLTVINTVVHVMLGYAMRMQHSSFVFTGAAQPGETESNTKRFRVYRNIMERMFGSDNFVHFASEQYSVYMLIRRTETDLVDGSALMTYLEQNYIMGLP